MQAEILQEVASEIWLNHDFCVSHQQSPACESHESRTAPGKGIVHQIEAMVHRVNSLRMKRSSHLRDVSVGSPSS